MKNRPKEHKFSGNVQSIILVSVLSHSKKSSGLTGYETSQPQVSFVSRGKSHVVS